MKNLSYNQATKLYKMHIPNTPNYLPDKEAELYGDMERYGIMSDSFGLATAIAGKLVKPVGDHIVKEIVVPVAKYVVKEVSVEMKGLTIELMKGLTEQIKEAVKQEIDIMQSKIKALPSEIIEGVKSSINIKLPWKAATMETSDDDYKSYTYNTYSGLEI